MDNLFIGKIPITQERYFNPFSNLLDMIQYYYDMAQRNNIEELDCFIDAEYSAYRDSFPKLQHTEELQNTIIKKTAEWMIGHPDNDWLNFDETRMDQLLDNAFFQEYRFQERKFYHKYAFLELYTYSKLQSLAVTQIPQIRSVMAWYFLCYNDMIESIMSFGFFTPLADIYQKWGWRWFTYTIKEDHLDSVLYIWAAYASRACKHVHNIPKNTLKKDLMDIYSEFLILLTRSDSLQQNEQYLSFLKKEIQCFDDDEIGSLKNQIQKTEHQNFKLMQDKKTIERSYAVLKQEIKKLQNDQYRTDDEKAKGIIERIYAALPENKDQAINEVNISKVWDKLSPLTQKNIETALNLYQSRQRADLASFLLISCIETEMKGNFFAPFKESSLYRSIQVNFCNNKRYKQVHNALYKKGIYPTMGAIPFVGRAVNSPKAIANSEVIAKFAEFLSDEKEAFCKICRAIDTYRIGLNKLSILNIRNGVAHGDPVVEEKCNQQCFKDIKHFLYDPPLQIMISILLHSKNEK